MTTKLTADTITDEQIRELREQAQRNYAAYGLETSREVFELCGLALHGGKWNPPSPRPDARARCADILNARAKESA